MKPADEKRKPSDPIRAPTCRPPGIRRDSTGHGIAPRGTEAKRREPGRPWRRTAWPLVRLAPEMLDGIGWRGNAPVATAGLLHRLFLWGHDRGKKREGGKLRCYFNSSARMSA
jgi:hypothetical protein